MAIPEKVYSSNQTAEMNDRKELLSALWIFVLLNYLFAFGFSLVFSPAVQNMAMRMTEGTVLVWAIIMETAIAIILLSRILEYNENRLVNIMAGILHTGAVAWTLFNGMQAPYYNFFAVIEIACTIFIVWYAWTWPNPEHQSSLVNARSN